MCFLVVRQLHQSGGEPDRSNFYPGHPELLHLQGPDKKPDSGEADEERNDGFRGKPEKKG